ncbi:hypothetical protein Fmac_025565 [Flemingia macrophylla]|uniref:Uncharacterized protein n=1 Tax=Flemingia macrophylla TaxID=520843 RepID=A0ABD1LSL6_9FABA
MCWRLRGFIAWFWRIVKNQVAVVLPTQFKVAIIETGFRFTGPEAFRLCKILARQNGICGLFKTLPNLFSTVIKKHKTSIV